MSPDPDEPQAGLANPIPRNTSVMRSVWTCKLALVGHFVAAAVFVLLFAPALAWA
ncbi:MAG TPA: hypothetical protein VE523_02445 [Solirubrobacterales bacterium]|jgi:hypothetical protein|nr:hypothetical protein [Solirubrobacterales bacterium]